jgi:membrane protease subunit HflC
MEPATPPSSSASASGPKVSASVLAVRATLALAAAAAVLASTSLFVVNENETVLVQRLGRPVRVLGEAGLAARLPWPVESLTRIDRRLRYADLRISESLTEDKRNLVLHLYFAWRVEDPARYATSVGEADVAAARLNSILTSAKNAVLGRTPYERLVSVETGSAELAKFEAAVLEMARADASANLGVALEAVGVTQVSLPEANVSSVFERMRAERKQFAAKFRSEGRQMADELRARTDAERALTLAEARRYAEETKAKGEADAARLYAEAHGQDPDFYAFLRKLQSLRTIVDDNTTLVLDTAAPPFDVLRQGPAAAPAPALAAPSVPREGAAAPRTAAMPADPPADLP